jgi:hypothetical protein
MSRAALLNVVVLVLIPTLAGAQWVNTRLPGVPRLPNGAPNLAAPVPHTADGTPDLSGVWASVADRTDVPLDSTPIPRSRAGSDIALGIPGGAPETAWAKEVHAQRRQSRAIPTERCLPSGIPPDMLRPSLPFKIVQARGVTVILLEEFVNWRQILTDGRSLPPPTQPAWYGYSIGRWNGDAFVVTTAGFNDQTWLDGSGLPHSEELRLTERFRRLDYGHMEIDYTFEDPKAFTRPWSTTVKFELQVDTDLMDHQCENQKWSGANR